jgi:hypothetical protein
MVEYMYARPATAPQMTMQGTGENVQQQHCNNHHHHQQQQQQQHADLHSDQSPTSPVRPAPRARTPCAGAPQALLQVRPSSARPDALNL